MNFDELYEQIQAECLPGLWGKGVALARAGAVIEESRSEADGELITRVHAKDRPTSPKVTLWTDGDWFCDCGDKNATCAFVAAAVIAAKNGLTRQKSAESARAPAAPTVAYRFARSVEGLLLERHIAYGAEAQPLVESLVSYVGGISSGRIQARPVAATKEDYGIDALVGRKRGALDAELMRKVLGLLRDNSNVSLDGQPVRVNPHPVGTTARVSDEGGGFKLEALRDASITEAFANGVALCGEALRPFDSYTFESRLFSPREVGVLVSEVLPRLSKRVTVDIATPKLPKLVEVEPRAVLKLEPLGPTSLSVVARIVYGNPPIAEVVGPELKPLSTRELPARNEVAEHGIRRRLQTELHLVPGAVTKFEGEGAVGFRLAAQGWSLEGAAAQGKFDIRSSPLEARLSADESGLGLGFQSADGHADPERVLRAWREGSEYVPLLEGGYARLPKDWLERYGDRVRRLLEAREDASGKMPAHLRPELAALVAEAGGELAEGLERLKNALEKLEGLPRAPLPGDLTAELRSYQRQGVDWLCFLRDQGLGAMLADDMGLGKTLQALCALEGHALVVTPTSVLDAWVEQIEKFRPRLKICVYHGGARELDPAADVVLTTYSILRLDREKLASREWGTVILDEAQLIKNPDSQVARAAFELRGRFRLTLTGTPVENRLEDLWSQMHFLNPGLLGSRAEFQAGLAARVARWEREAAARLRSQIRPFLLRRLKRDVAPELPPRTETVLHCVLSAEERQTYEAILAATRADVLSKLEQGAAGGVSVLAALEALLRLRQACCHPGLIPGQKPLPGAGSAKVELLVESLKESIDNGHRALVFSQWTSLLDLVEPALTAAGITFTRLDGSTPDRGKVVDEFQAATGASVMLISLKAGGVGLTLTAADHIYLMDPWWNPAAEDQAADRAHRIGQKNPVLIQRLVAKDTIEDRVLALQKRKLEVAHAVLQDAAGAATLTRQDILELLKDDR